MNIKNWLRKEELIEITLIFISAITLIIGFIKPNLLFFDLSWITIILCGLPIIKEAIEALIHEKDIKSDFACFNSHYILNNNWRIICCRSYCFNNDYWRVFRRIYSKQNSK